MAFLFPLFTVFAKQWALVQSSPMNLSRYPPVSSMVDNSSTSINNCLFLNVILLIVDFAFLLPGVIYRMDGYPVQQNGTLGDGFKFYGIKGNRIVSLRDNYTKHINYSLRISNEFTSHSFRFSILFFSPLVDKRNACILLWSGDALFKTAIYYDVT